MSACCWYRHERQMLDSAEIYAIVAAEQRRCLFVVAHGLPEAAVCMPTCIAADKSTPSLVPLPVER